MSNKVDVKILSTGVKNIDKLLNGGIKGGTLTHAYGKARSGKTTLAIQTAVNVAVSGWRTLYVDAENSFSPQRLRQISGTSFDRVAKEIVVFKPTTFVEQSNIVDNIEKYIVPKVKLIIVDTIATLYRVELGDSQRNFALNRELNRQLAMLLGLAKKYGIAILITNQVRDVMVEGVVGIEPVGKRVLEHWTTSSLFLEVSDYSKERKIKLIGHPQDAETVTYCVLTNEGLKPLENKEIP
ncbi:MAG: AAA family ATPase [Candidatus Hodarchaeota archaeon]